MLASAVSSARDETLAALAGVRRRLRPDALTEQPFRCGTGVRAAARDEQPHPPHARLDRTSRTVLQCYRSRMGEEVSGPTCLELALLDPQVARAYDLTPVTTVDSSGLRSPMSWCMTARRLHEPRSPRPQTRGLADRPESA